MFAAVAPERGVMTSLGLPSADTPMMQLFLAHLSETCGDFFLVRHVDQAGWHRSKTFVIPENIRLIEQPASRPEVNPVEHVWDELREKDLHTLVCSSLDALIELLCKGLTPLTPHPERLHSMMFFPHFRIEV